MQEMKASKYPTIHNHPKHYTVILKIMLLAQEAKHPRKNKKNFSTLRNKHIQHSSDGLRGSDSQSHRKSLRRDSCRGVSPSSLLHEAQTV